MKAETAAQAAAAREGQEAIRAAQTGGNQRQTAGPQKPRKSTRTNQAM
ncbi:MAG: hypothetical protein ACKO96_00575 [Flammeovirgaceae bacterium]